jgi:O6-methylguanine-DNA--protein-cysteine methyltransferase
VGLRRQGSAAHKEVKRLTELPHQNPSRIKTRETRLYYQNKMRDKYAKSKAINEVVAAIKRGEFIHYSDIAKKYKCDYSALSKRVCGLIKTKKDADSFWR